MKNRKPGQGKGFLPGASSRQESGPLRSTSDRRPSDPTSPPDPRTAILNEALDRIANQSRSTDSRPDPSDLFPPRSVDHASPSGTSVRPGGNRLGEVLSGVEPTRRDRSDDLSPGQDEGDSPDADRNGSLAASRDRIDNTAVVAAVGQSGVFEPSGSDNHRTNRPPAVSAPSLLRERLATSDTPGPLGSRGSGPDGSGGPSLNARFDSTLGLGGFLPGLVDNGRGSGSLGVPSPVIDGQGFARLSGLDSVGAGLPFPGAPGQANDTGSPFDQGAFRGARGSSASSADQGTAIDLSKTNELLQQLLDEVRRGKQPFLPLNDRSSSL